MIISGTRSPLKGTKQVVVIDTVRLTSKLNKTTEIYYVEHGHRASGKSWPADQFSDRIRNTPTCYAMAQKSCSKQQQGVQL